MPVSTSPMKPCPMLQSRAISVLAKSLQRAFFVLGTKNNNSPLLEDLLKQYNSHQVLKDLSQKDENYLIQQIRGYISPRLPVKFRQQLFDDILNALTTPEFDPDNLMTTIEYEFKLDDNVAKSSDMNHIMEAFFKCLLMGYVSMLDLSTLYKAETHWLVRALRHNATVHQDKNASEWKFCSYEVIWHEMGREYREGCIQAALAAAPLFKHLSAINIDNVATGDLIWAIGKYCPLLLELSLLLNTRDSSEYDLCFEDELIMSLSALYGHKMTTPTSFPGKTFGCPKLQKIVLPIVESREKLWWIETRFLLYLSHLKVIINGNTTVSIEGLLTSSKYSGKPLSLTHIEDTGTVETIEDLLQLYNKNIQSILPNVTSAKVVHTKQRKGLQYLSSFPKLKNLEVISEKGGELEFACNFTRVTHLKTNTDWDQKKLAAFSQRASRLEVFVMTHGSLTRHKNSKNLMSFHALRILKLCEMDNFDNEVFINIVKSTKCLTHLIFETKPRYRRNQCVLPITDGLVASLLPSLKKLQVFHVGVMIPEFSTARVKFALTMKSVKGFVQGCPDLKYLGNLFNWDVPMHEIQNMRTQIEQQSSCLYVNSAYPEFCNVYM